MAIHYQMMSESGLLTVVATGTDEDLAEVKNYGLAVIGKAVELGCRKILCDERDLEYNLSVVDTHESARFISEQAPDVARIAIVFNPKFKCDAKFWEKVATARGLTVRAFQTKPEAIRWLEMQ